MRKLFLYEHGSTVASVKAEAIMWPQERWAKQQTIHMTTMQKELLRCRGLLLAQHLTTALYKLIDLGLFEQWGHSGPIAASGLLDRSSSLL